MLTTTLNDGTVVLAKESIFEGKPVIAAKTYANRTQANEAAQKIGAGWAVAKRGRPWYVAKQ